MNKKDNILNQFENIPLIEPSSEWNNQLLQKFDDANRVSPGLSVTRLVMVALVALLILNIFSFSKNILNASRQTSSNNMKKIATEFLISTNSSKF
jgi:hypothetical protein